jgi:hypothetical protein
MLLVGVVVIAAIVIGAFFVMNNSKGTPGGSGSPVASGSLPASGAVSSTVAGGGSIVFVPSTIGCPGQGFTTNIVLPASVKATDTITYQIDDTTIIAQTVADFGFAQQANGTWSISDINQAGSTHCDMGPGKHTARLIDANGKVLAQGAFTFIAVASPTAKLTVAPKPTPTPKPVAQGWVTIDPATMSCSAASVSVSLSVVLPGSIPASAMISSELDGTIANTERADVGFVKQPDGTWLSSGTTDSSTLCSQLTIGDHTIRALDASGNTLAEGTLTLEP